MGRGRTYANGWCATIRLALRNREPQVHASTAASLDRILRRATSVSSFALRLDAVPARRELVIRVAAIRHQPTHRADASVLPLLRRLIPQAQRRTWIQVPRGSNDGSDMSVFVDYEVVETDVAQREMVKISSQATVNSCISTSDAPIVVIADASTSSSATGS